MALAYCTSNRGGCHLRAYPISHEILRKPVPTDRFSFSGKAPHHQDRRGRQRGRRFAGRLQVLFFRRDPGGVRRTPCQQLPGWSTPHRDLRTIGERIYLTERFYNCANGFDASDDLLPERFFAEPGSSGEGIVIPPLDRVRFGEELQKYYRIRGLTPGGTFARSRLPANNAMIQGTFAGIIFTAR